MIFALTPRLFGSKWGWLNFIPLCAVATLFFSRSPRGGELFGYLHEIGLTGFGLYLFAAGFAVVRERWVVQNTPTSKVRSAAMGVCELKGKAREKSPLKSPLSLADCVYYEFRIERQRRDSKGRTHWVAEKEGSSTNYFYIDDGTGKMLVDPLNTTTTLAVDYTAIEPVSGRKMRYTERYIKPGDDLYVLGTVRPFKDNLQERKDRLLERLRKLKADKEQMKSFDTDGDGVISTEEWDRARQHVEEEVLKEELARSAETPDDIVIARGDAEKTFIIADCGEKELAKNLFLKGAGMCSGGGLVIAAMAVSVVARAGLLPACLAIPWGSLYRH